MNWPRIPGPRKHPESYEELRARMLDETAAFLTVCLRHPELAVRIPVIPAGKGRFPPSFSAAFWEPIFSE